MLMRINLFSAVETLMECLRLFEVNYPETLKEAYVINGIALQVVRQTITFSK